MRLSRYLLLSAEDNQTTKVIGDTDDEIIKEPIRKVLFNFFDNGYRVQVSNEQMTRVVLEKFTEVSNA